MAAIAILAFAAVAALFAGAEALLTVGGATSIGNSPVIPAWQALPAPNYNSYVSTSDFLGSGDGKLKFYDKVYQVAFSDDTYTKDQYSSYFGATSSVGGSIFTLPIASTFYTFFYHGTASGLQLTATKIVQIFTETTNPGVSWAYYASSSVVSGFTYPVARSDSSGTTEVITTYLNKAGGLKAVTQDAKTVFSSRVIYVAKSSGIKNELISKYGTIGYLQAGYSATAQRVYEIQLQNLAGQYVTTSVSDPNNNIPRSLPGFDRDWSFILAEEQNPAGTGVFPIASVIYTFAQKVYSSGAYSGLVRGFYRFLYGSAAQGKLSVGNFHAIPTGSIAVPALNAVNTIKP